MSGKYDRYFTPADGEPVELAAPRPRTTSVLSLRLRSEDMDALVAEAGRRGTTVGALGRDFIKEGLQQSRTVRHLTVQFENMPRGAKVLVLEGGIGFHSDEGGGPVFLGRGALSSSHPRRHG